MLSNGDRKIPSDYGQDAPGVRRGMFIAGMVGVSIPIAMWILSAFVNSIPYWIIIGCQLIGAAVTLYGFGMATYMTWGSKIGKLKTRDDLLERAGSLRPWSGNEVVLDVGCGRGLMLLGAAKRLKHGTAFGIDLWREQDQANNSPEAVLENARREGVQDRIRLETGDARNLPMTDSSVDVVLSHWVVHNLESDEDRKKALNEMWRVLRPNGVLVLADIAHVPSYVSYLKELGAKECSMIDGGLEARIMGVLSGGSFKPQALICLR